MSVLKQFHWADYVVTVAMLLISLSIGFFFAFFKGGQKTKVEYLLGNRKMKLGPVCLSLFATFVSAISLIGFPADVYNTGPMVMYINYGIAIAYVVGYFTVVPLMYPLHLTSVYEYLEMRFKSRAVRLLGTSIGMLQTTLYMGVALYSPALALQAAAGLPLWMSVALVGGIGTLYTAVGGIKSVVWTDAFQIVIVFIGITTVFTRGVMAVGGFGNMFEIAERGHRTDFAIMNPDPRERHSMWACLIGSCITWLVNCFNQSSVQRIGSLKTLRDANISFLLNVPLHMIYATAMAFTGILLYAYVVTIGCDPYEAGLIDNKNQIMPFFVIHVLNDLPGFAGLYMSMLFSGALSTVSSSINALTANSVEDLLSGPLGRLRDATVTVIAKLLSVFYGLLAIGLAYLMKTMDGPVTQLATTAFGACGGPVVGIFLLGGAFPRGNKYGALCGALLGLAINMWVAVGCRLYGKPIASLPGGPVDNCYMDNTTSALNSSSSVSVLLQNNYTAGYIYNGSSVTVGTVTETTGMNFTTTILPAEDDESFSIYDISYLWLGTVGVVTSFVTGILVSLLTGSTDVETLDTRLIFPFCRKLYRLKEPLHRPEDTSNVIAMEKYHEAHERLKEGLNHEMTTRETKENGQEHSNLLSLEDGRA